MKELRQSMLAETEIAATKRRFGLFSQPPSIAIGDSSYFSSKTARKGEDGKPITQPRNMLAGPNKSGVTKRDFITSSSSIYVGDKYLDPEKLQRQSELKYHSKAKFHEMDFKTSSGQKILVAAPYPHIDEKPAQKKRPARDRDSGRVITQDRNINSNPLKKVQNDFFKPLKHIADPYERRELFESQEKKISKSKMGPQIFRTMSHGNIFFTVDKRLYGQDDKVKELVKSKKSLVQTPPKIVHHEVSFKLARRGHGDPLGKYPQFIPPIAAKSQIKKVSKERSQREEWKPNGNKSLTRPTPSISFSAFSLRKYY